MLFFCVYCSNLNKKSNLTEAGRVSEARLRCDNIIMITSLILSIDNMLRWVIRKLWIHIASPLNRFLLKNYVIIIFSCSSFNYLFLYNDKYNKMQMWARKWMWSIILCFFLLKKKHSLCWNVCAHSSIWKLFCVNFRIYKHNESFICCMCVAWHDTTWKFSPSAHLHEAVTLSKIFLINATCSLLSSNGIIKCSKVTNISCRDKLAVFCKLCTMCLAFEAIKIDMITPWITSSAFCKLFYVRTIMFFTVVL